MHDAKLRRDIHIPADMPIRDLGAIELSANTPRIINLGVGKDLTVTAYSMTNNMLQMSVAYTYEHQPLVGRETQPYAKPKTNICKPDEEMVILYYTEPAGRLAVVMKPKLISR
jgi:hypothetical protein